MNPRPNRQARLAFLISASALLAIPLIAAQSALADELPNLEPGNWEYTTVMKVEADFPFPDQTNVTTECITQEELERGEGLFEMEEMDECEITRKDLRRDGLNYSMTCSGPDGMDFSMDTEMRFMGERSEGSMSGDMQTPMGPMRTTIQFQGRRIGDC